MARGLTRRQPASDLSEPNPIAAYYREEFLKQLTFLRLQRSQFSEGAVVRTEQAFDRLLDELDALCTRQNAAETLERWLAGLAAVTGVPSQYDRKQIH